MLSELLRILKWPLVCIGGMLVLVIGSPLLLFIGKSQVEMVVDPELLEDDPGVDVDQGPP